MVALCCAPPLNVQGYGFGWAIKFMVSYNNTDCPIFPAENDWKTHGLSLEKSFVYTLELSQKSNFQSWTTKSDNNVHSTIETGQI